MSRSRLTKIGSGRIGRRGKKERTKGRRAEIGIVIVTTLHFISAPLRPAQSFAFQPHPTAQVPCPFLPTNPPLSKLPPPTPFILSNMIVRQGRAALSSAPPKEVIFISRIERRRENDGGAGSIIRSILIWTLNDWWAAFEGALVGVTFVWLPEGYPSPLSS
ncbi:hypothetical protein IE53DRAFT_390409 [Violaceomyces palustris]|uniref:Uncharacterized protein n=1 Tax=Violaceomyces palustris TaxID=1673888 RepID=A0ACD0NNS6_9BASI|nr:hypothetical protein IE53DRAFT_390409 [Violaceomyces palustris]